MNHKQSLRAMRRQAEREQRAEKQRQAAAILATRDLEERKRLLAKAMADSEKEARNQAVEYCFHSIYAAVLLAAQEVYGFGHKRRLSGYSIPVFAKITQGRNSGKCRVIRCSSTVESFPPEKATAI